MFFILISFTELHAVLQLHLIHIIHTILFLHGYYLYFSFRILIVQLTKKSTAHWITYHTRTQCAPTVVSILQPAINFVPGHSQW